MKFEKSLSLTQIKILEALADGQCLSGSMLGNMLQISRAAVWKQVKQLIELGVPLKSHAKQGYQLTIPIHLLVGIW